MKFWKAVFDAWKDSLPYAMTINDQIPPDFDANSLGRLRRVDYAIDFYDSDRRNRSFTLIFIEGKGANTGASVYDMVEAQAHNACETYAKAPGTHSNLVYAMCTVGTRFRFFVWRASGETDGALITLIGDKPNGRADEYIDAADREKGYVFLKALRFILANAPATFADRSILYVRPFRLQLVHTTNIFMASARRTFLSSTPPPRYLVMHRMLRVYHQQAVGRGAIRCRLR